MQIKRIKEFERLIHNKWKIFHERWAFNSMVLKFGFNICIDSVVLKVSAVKLIYFRGEYNYTDFMEQQRYILNGYEERRYRNIPKVERHLTYISAEFFTSY